MFSAIRVGSDMDVAEQADIVIEESDVDTTEQTDNMIKESDEDTARKAGEKLHEHRTQTDEVTGAIATHVGSDMSVTEQTDIVIEAVCLEEEIEIENKREENGAAAAKKTLKTNDGVSKEDVEVRRLIEERRSTSKGEKQRLKDFAQTN